MNNTDLVRKLIKEFLLNEIFSSTASRQQNVFDNLNNNIKLYGEWLKYFKESVKNLNNIKNIENIKLRLFEVPQNYNEYDNWLHKEYDGKGFKTTPLSTIRYVNNHGFELLDFNDWKNSESVKTESEPNKIDLSNSIDFYASDVIKDPSIIQKHLVGFRKDTNYGESLIAEIINHLDEKNNARKTEGKFDAYDIDSNLGKFEVKFNDRSSIMAGESSNKYARKFRDTLVEFVKEVFLFYESIKGNLDNSQVSLSFISAVENFNKVPKNNPNKSELTLFQHIEKGNLPDSTVMLVKDLIKKAESVKSYLLTNKKNNEKLSINDKEIIIKGPELKYAFYKTVRYFENLGIDLNINRDDLDYKSSLLNPNAISIIDNIKNEISIPRNSFLESITGLFIIMDASSDPKIKYIREDEISSKLTYIRVTPSRGGPLRIQFKPTN